uniref:Uncharacterized protein n=1 Tax=Anguilla anguilla TaxID=7936 RepID=A0A0E9RA43_ANGAN
MKYRTTRQYKNSHQKLKIRIKYAIDVISAS